MQIDKWQERENGLVRECYVYLWGKNLNIGIHNPYDGILRYVSLCFSGIGRHNSTTMEA